MPKSLEEMSNNFIQEDDFDYSYEEGTPSNDFDYSDLEESEMTYDINEDIEDYADIETMEAQYERENDIEEIETIDEKPQSIILAIFLSLIGKQNGYTSIDNKLQNNTSKVIFMIASLLFLMLMFVVIGIFMR